jgi:hypothetical protein
MRWEGAELERLRISYEESDMPLEYIAAEMRTSLGSIARVARINGWKPRRPVSTAKFRNEALVQRHMARMAFVVEQITRYERELGGLLARVRELRDG